VLNPEPSALNSQVIHPHMDNAEDIFQAWLKDEVRPGRGGLTSTSVTGGVFALRLGT